MAIIISTLVMSIVLLSCPATAGSAEEVKSPTTTFSGPQVVASFVDPAEKIFVWRDVRLQLAIINGNSPIGVESITISVPRRTGWATDKDSNSEPCIDCVNIRTEPFDLRNPGEKRDLGIVYVRPAEWKALRDEYLAFLFYRPRKEAFLVNLNYRPLAEASGASRVQSTRLDVNVAAHPLGMYLGALFGVVLATALVWCYRATKAVSSGQAAQPQTPQPTSTQPLQAPNVQPVQASTQTTPNPGSPWWLRLIRGALASLIAILLFQTTSDISFPITVTVHDFYGGVLLGLFGDKVAESIWTKI